MFFVSKVQAQAVVALAVFLPAFAAATEHLLWPLQAHAADVHLLQLRVPAHLEDAAAAALPATAVKMVGGMDR
jgi:hypothetical protein